MSTTNPAGEAQKGSLPSGAKQVTAAELYERLKASNGHRCTGGAPEGFFKIHPAGSLETWYINAYEHDLLNFVLDAREWRVKNGFVGRGGFVVLSYGQPCGWISKLDDASAWIPGCLAINEDALVFRAIGGNYQKGAREWFKDSLLSSAERKQNEREDFAVGLGGWTPPHRPKAEGYPRFKYTGDDALVLYRMPVGSSEYVEVVGDPGNASYEWVIRGAGGITRHSDCGYGDVTVAMRDGLIAYEGLGDAMGCLIWSIEHNAWWRPNSAGCTREKSQAGRYSFETANGIVQSANRGLNTPNEAIVLESEVAA